MRSYAKMASYGLAICLVTGCANQGTRDAGGVFLSSGGCNPAIAAGIGALLGGVIAQGSNRTRGAAVGASIGALACVAFNYSARQTKSAQQVNQEYLANQGRLPTSASVMRYSNTFDPGTVIRPGQALRIHSDIEVVQGTDTRRPIIEEEFVLFRPDGREVTRSRKPANSGQGAGAFSTTFAISLPEGVPQGAYPLQVALYLNGAKVADRSTNLQVVMRQVPSYSVAAID